MSEKHSRFSWDAIRRLLIGKPIATSRAHSERLSPFLGLPVFASDALSSVAYATEAILGILVLAGALALHEQIYITLGICILIAIIGISYNQTIHAYPSGGGSYIVASDNLGEKCGLIAGAALLIDYVLTVSVSIAAGIGALVSAFPVLNEHLVSLSLISIFFIAFLNLRGVRESGVVFAIPVYSFVIGIIGLIIIGLFRSHGAPVHQHVVSDALGKEVDVSALYLLLRAFAAGCTALTGVEAVSNGVPAFKHPESDNASKTLKWMVIFLGIMFIGIGLLARTIPHLSLFTSNSHHYKSLISQIAAYYLGGDHSVGFYFVQFTTALILVLAANTSFADFPRLASLLARDGFLPRTFARQGDRLVFHNGIILLALFSGFLIFIFHGQLDLLLPLYAIGVFTAFTLSQAGMVIHWRRVKGAGWKRSAVINGVGSVLSGIVLLVILITKFVEGAWIVAVLMVAIYAMFCAIKMRYRRISEELTENIDAPMTTSGHKVILLVPRVHRGILYALDYALLIKGDVEAVHVTIDDRSLPGLRRNWQKHGRGVPLNILASPYRSLIDPLLEYIDELHKEDNHLVITVIVPEAVGTKMIQKVLQENVGLQLKIALSTRRRVVVTNVRYFIT